MHFVNMEALAFEVACHAMDIYLFRHKYDGSFLGIGQQFFRHEFIGVASEEFPQYPDDHIRFLRFVTQTDLLPDFVSRLRNGNLHNGRLVHDSFSQALRLLGHSCRKEHFLAVVGQLLGNGHDVIIKAHIQHTVGLIQHKIAHLRKIHIPKIQMR